MRRIHRFAALAAAALSVTAVVGHASASPAAPTRGGTIAALNASESSNWSGYNQGILEPGKSPFTQVSGTWTVPTARQHQAGQDEYSSAWVGIGGGCLDTSCTATDNTLIQAGTEHDIDAKGNATYGTWWEIIPGPSLDITSSVPVKPGDQVSVDIVETVPGLWTITVKNLTTGKTWSQAVPYTSTHGTAEWILETPLLIGTSGTGISAMPDLTGMRFDNGKANGKAVALDPAEAINLVSNGQRVATPSAPDSQLDGFNDCTWTTTCASPSGTTTALTSTSPSKPHPKSKK